jgi:hypothetical protein
MKLKNLLIFLGFLCVGIYFENFFIPIIVYILFYLFTHYASVERGTEYDQTTETLKRLKLDYSIYPKVSQNSKQILMFTKEYVINSKKEWIPLRKGRIIIGGYPRGGTVHKKGSLLAKKLGY